MVTQKLPPKREVMLALLQQAESVFVNFDPRREGVLVPPQLKRQARVVLQYGMNMAIPIADLDVGEEGIGASLSFDRVPCWTFVPWKAVFAIVSPDQRGMLWEADLPGEVDGEADKSPSKKSPAQRPVAASKKRSQRPVLRAVKADDGTASAAPVPTPPKPTLTVTEARVAPGQRPTPDAEERVTSNVDKDPPPSKKKRELPSYLRVVK